MMQLVALENGTVRTPMIGDGVYGAAVDAVELVGVVLRVPGDDALVAE